MVALVRRVVASARRLCTSRAAQAASANGAAPAPQLAPTRPPVGAVLVMVSIVLTLMALVGQAQSPPDVRTDTERLKVEVLALKAQLARAIADGDACRMELAPTRTRLNALAITAEGDTLAAALEAAHPGYRVNRTTWQLEAAGAPSPHTP